MGGTMHLVELVCDFAREVAGSVEHVVVIVVVGLEYGWTGPGSE